MHYTIINIIVVVIIIAIITIYFNMKSKRKKSV